MSFSQRSAAKAPAACCNFYATRQPRVTPAPGTAAGLRLRDKPKSLLPQVAPPRNLRYDAKNGRRVAKFATKRFCHVRSETHCSLRNTSAARRRTRRAVLLSRPARHSRKPRRIKSSCFDMQKLRWVSDTAYRAASAAYSSAPGNDLCPRGAPQLFHA